jgi:hypothetical protein
MIWFGSKQHSSGKKEKRKEKKYSDKSFIKKPSRL